MRASDPSRKRAKIGPAQSHAYLTDIDAKAMRRAIEEFNRMGRADFLKHYAFGRSSKFYLIFRERFYDAKALVAAAYEQATGKRLGHREFAGGAQTLAVYRRLARRDAEFTLPFEDNFGELRKLSNEYDRIPHSWANLGELGFSKWIPLARSRELKTGWLPGVYVLARAKSRPSDVSIVDRRVVYIGETVSQSIRKRLDQLRQALGGRSAHSGGETLWRKGCRSAELWVAIRSFPLGYGIEDKFAESFRSAQIRHLERMLLYEYVTHVRAYPCGNSK